MPSRLVRPFALNVVWQHVDATACGLAVQLTRLRPCTQVISRDQAAAYMRLNVVVTSMLRPQLSSSGEAQRGSCSQKYVNTSHCSLVYVLADWYNEANATACVKLTLF